MSPPTSAGRLIFTGGVIVDLVLHVGALPEPGGDTIASYAQVAAGGGYNVITAAGRDGLAVVFAGLYGTGPFGDIVAAALRDAGVEVIQPAVPDQDSGYCVALVDASAERTFVTVMGAEDRLGAAELDRIRVDAKDMVYVSGYSLTQPVGALALTSWLEGLPPSVRVISDPSPLIGDVDPDVLARVLRRTDVLSANAREARILTGLAEPGPAARQLLGLIAEAGQVVVRDGPAGCWLATRPEPDPIRVEGFEVEVVDTTGAGDTHVGVLAAALSRGLATVQAAVRANAAAALAVTRPGPGTAPTGAEIDRLLARAEPRRRG